MRKMQVSFEIFLVIISSHFLVIVHGTSKCHILRQDMEHCKVVCKGIEDYRKNCVSECAACLREYNIQRTFIKILKCLLFLHLRMCKWLDQWLDSKTFPHATLACILETLVAVLSCRSNVLRGAPKCKWPEATKGVRFLLVTTNLLSVIGGILYYTRNAVTCGWPCKKKS